MHGDVDPFLRSIHCWFENAIIKKKNSLFAVEIKPRICEFSFLISVKKIYPDQSMLFWNVKKKFALQEIKRLLILDFKIFRIYRLEKKTKS